MLANPLIWGSAILDLSCLRDRVWLTHNAMNFYLLARWSIIRHTSESYFISMSFTHQRVTPDPTSEEATFFRRLYPAPDIPPRRVVFIGHCAEHYFACVFDYEFQTAWLLGSNFKRTGSFQQGDVIWDEWNGGIVWKYIANLFGWRNVINRPERIIGIDWVQVWRSA
jgi:hypothetical protein